MIKLRFWPWGYAPCSILRESNENWSLAVNKKPAIAQQTLAHASVALVRALFVNLSQFYVRTRKCKYIQILEQKFTQFFKVWLLSIHVCWNINTIFKWIINKLSSINHVVFFECCHKMAKNREIYIIGNFGKISWIWFVLNARLKLFCTCT